MDEIMAPIKVPENLPELVRSTFNKAKANGELMYFPSQVAVLTANSIPFQIRFAPSLASKPKGQISDPKNPKVKQDPFANPPAALKLCDLEPGKSHYLVLNKFAITPCHFILATTENKPQSHLLEADDLEAAMACVCAYRMSEEAGTTKTEEKEGGIFVFFNSGQHSGASQSHRHLQLIPVGEMKKDLPLGAGKDWETLIGSVPSSEEIKEVEGWPFRSFSVNVSPSMDGQKLRELYLGLYRLACRAIDEYAESRGFAVVAEHAHDIGITDGEAWISYNLAMTDSRMVLTPRMREGADVTDAEGKCVGALMLNGTVLAGTALVKSEAEWEALRNDSTKLEAVLGKIGVPRL